MACKATDFELLERSCNIVKQLSKKSTGVIISDTIIYKE